MKRNKNPRKREFLIIVIGMIIFVVTFLKSQGIDFVEHQEYLVKINQQKQDYSLLEKNILKTRHELLSSFDIFPWLLNRIKENQLQLSKIPDFIDKKSKQNMESMLQVTSGLELQIETNLEEFKTKSVILKNSLNYLPNSLAIKNDISPDMYAKAAYDSIVNKTILYELTSDTDLINIIENEIKDLDLMMIQQKKKDDTSGKIDVGINHAKIIIDYKSQVDSRVEKMLESPILELINQFDVTYNLAYEGAIKQASYYRSSSYISLLIVLGTIANYVIRQIIQSKNVVTKLLNKSQEDELILQELNQTLETKVEERTKSLHSTLKQKIGLNQRLQIDLRLVSSLGNLMVNLLHLEDPEKIRNTISQEIYQVMSVDRVAISLIDDKSNHEIVAEVVNNNYLKIRGSHLKSSKSHQINEILLLNDIRTYALNDKFSQELKRWKVKSAIISPLFLENQLIGFLILHQCSNFRKWQEIEIQYISQISTYFSLLLQNKKLLDNLRQRSLMEKETNERIQSQVAQLVKDISPVAKGNLSIRSTLVDGDIGYIASTYNKTLDSLISIISTVTEVSLKIAKLTRENENIVHCLSEKTTIQLEKVSDTNNSVERFKQSSDIVVTNIQNVAEAVIEAHTTVLAAQSAMILTVKEFNSIQNRVESAADIVRKLKESIQQISKISDLINSFADITGMLAFNASVEATRAGEFGACFDVIAKEIRALSDQSTNSISEINNIIDEIVGLTDSSFEIMELTKSQVADGTSFVNESKNSLDSILRFSEHINQLVEGITEQIINQKEAEMVVSSSITDVATIANEISDSAETMNDSFKYLLASSQDLQDSVSQFIFEQKKA